MRKSLQTPLFGRRWLTFDVMGVAFLAFGAGAVNLFVLLKANTELVLEHGLQARGDGAAQQLVELLVMVYLSMAAYQVFKACEPRLVHWLAGDE